MGSLESLCSSQNWTPEGVARMFLMHWAAACLTLILAGESASSNRHFFFQTNRGGKSRQVVPLLSQCLVHAVEDDVDPLRLAGAEERRSLCVQGVSAAKEGDAGEIHRAQLSQTAACRLCRGNVTLVQGEKKQGARRAKRLWSLPRIWAPPGWLAACLQSCSKLRTSFPKTLPPSSTGMQRKKS